MSRRVILGVRAVQEALRARARSLAVIYADERDPKLDREIEALAAKGRITIERRPKSVLDALADGGKHQGLVAIAGEYVYAEVEEILADDSRPLLIVALDQISDPHNFGAIVRSAVAFGADAVLTLKDRAAPVTPVVVRASAGATEHARIAQVTNLARTLAALRGHGLRVVGLAGEGTGGLDSLEYGPRGLVLVVGSEGTGLRRLVREHCDELVRIDMAGPIASLNASVAAGIALYAASRGRAQKGALAE